MKSSRGFAIGVGASLWALASFGFSAPAIADAGPDVVRLSDADRRTLVNIDRNVDAIRVILVPAAGGMLVAWGVASRDRRERGSS